MTERIWQSALVFLDKVLAFCVADHIWRYHVSEFEEVINTMKKEVSKDESIEKLQQSLRDKLPIKVEARDCARYATRVRQLTLEGSRYGKDTAFRGQDAARAF